MRFTIKREEFLKGLNIASRAISSKNAKAVLENFKLEIVEECKKEEEQLRYLEEKENV